MAQIKKDTRLRKAILQAAITGQLISTCHSELDSESAETGKELLDKIIEERNKKLLAEWEEALKKNPKAKKPVPVVASEIDEEEIPFDIPENWYWCRLGDVAEIKSSKRVFEKDYVLDGVPFFRSAEIGDLQQNKALKTELFISEKHFNELKNKYGVPQQGDLLITSVGTIGNTWISDGRDFYYKDGNITQISKNEFIIPEYFRLFIDSPVFTMQVFDTVAGTAYNALTIIKLKKLIFPLPPLAVQNAIVAKLEQVLPLVDAYENALLQKEELKSTLGDKVKKAILQEAITGHLTEAWRKSATIKESGKQLLDRIIEERNAKEKMSHGLDFANAKSGKKKAKKETALAGSNPCGNIPEDEIPFEVPESWCWCRLGDLFITSSGTTPASKNPDYYVNGTINWVRTTDLNNDVLTSTEIKITEKAKEDCNLRIIPQDSVCIALYGGAGTIGKNALIKFDTTINQSVCAIHPNGFCSMKYIQWFMQWQRPNWMELASGSRKDPNINQIIVKNCLIPLPPLEEQKEIVRKVEELLPLCK